jgi:tRNA(fMet)-specific endonuclease VapC
MNYLLDTNVCIKLLNGSSEAIIQRLAHLNPQQIYICSIVEFELYYGAYRSHQTEANLTKLKRFFQQFSSLGFDSKAAQVAGYWREHLNQKGLPIGVYDLQIASIAIVNDLTLVTHNVREFSRIGELVYEDWEW